MTYRPRRCCRRCGTDRDKAGGMSRSGLCPACGPVVYAESARQIVAHEGAHYEAYRDGLTDYVARLWGESLTPDKLAEAAELDIDQEVSRWLDGFSGPAATLTTPARTSTCSSA